MFFSRRLKPIIVLFTGHCGSSWFVDMIGNQPWCVRLGFEPIDDTIVLHGPRAAKVGAKQALSWNGRSPLIETFRPQSEVTDRTTSLCFKTRLRGECSTFFKKDVPRKRPLVIHLTRKDKLRAAVSNYKRVVLGISHLADFDQTEAKRAPVEVDCDYVIRKMHEFEWRDAAIDAYERDLPFPVYTVSYEELHADTAAAMMRLADQTGLPLQPVPSKYRKMTSPVISEAVSNFEELMKRVGSDSVCEAGSSSGP